MCQKNVVKKNVDLLLIEKECKRHYVLIKDFKKLLYDHTLHRERKHFCCYCLQALSTSKVLLKIALRLIVNKELRYLKR